MKNFYTTAAARDLDAAIDELQNASFRATPALFAALMRQCTLPSSLPQARRLQACVDRHGYAQDTLLQNLLIQMYGKCGCVDEARKVFARNRSANAYSWNILLSAYALNGHLHEASSIFRMMPSRDVVSWNSAIAAQGKRKEAFKLFQWMCQDGEPSPNSITLATLLDVAASIGELKEGRSVHEMSVECDLESDSIVGASLVHMYGKCGRVSDAKGAFDQIEAKSVVVWTSLLALFGQNGNLDMATLVFGRCPKRTVVTWNALLTAYARDGQARKAMDVYQAMKNAGVAPDKVTLVGVSDACTTLGVLTEGEEIHRQVRMASLCGDVQLRASLITMYSACDSIDCARQVFESLPSRDVVLWTAMIAAYARGGHLHDAKSLLQDEGMPKLGLVPSNMLITAFGQGRCIEEAKHVFDSMEIRDHVSWNSLISAYAENGECIQALKVFSEMDLEGLSPNSITYVHAFEACSKLESHTRGMLFYDEILASRSFDSDVLVQTAIINMLGKYGFLDQARDLFDCMSRRNRVSWNAMITAYAQSGQGREALKVFGSMDLEGLEPTKVTFISILDACADLGFLHAGKEILSSLDVAEACDGEPVLATAVVNMYSKCGMLAEAREIFDSSSLDRDSVSWSAMIAAYAQNGRHKDAIDVFHLMNLEGVAPSASALVLVLTACSHAGLLAVGLAHFRSIEVDFGLRTTENHYACLLDLLARSGRLGDAKDLVANMPFQPRSVEQTTLLSACKMHGSSRNVEGLGFAPKDAVEYVLLSNIYSSTYLEF